MFKVEDSGVGISDKDKEKLFTLFGRGEESSLLNKDGSGLGLMLCKKIIHKLKG